MANDEDQDVTSIAKFTRHLFGADLPVLLNIPEAKCAGSGGEGLRKSKVCILKEAKFEFLILTNRHKGPCCVQALE